MIPSALLDSLCDRALSEDLGGGDLTTAALVDGSARAVGRALAKTPLVVAGGDVFARVFYRVDPGVRVEQLVPDGTAVRPGDVLFVVEGPTASLLMAERTALNFVQRLSGVATLTAEYVKAVPHINAGTGKANPAGLVASKIASDGRHQDQQHANREAKVAAYSHRAPLLVYKPHGASKRGAEAGCLHFERSWVP
jgi:nicotinate-nucleotide pyrophosphorylase